MLAKFNFGYLQAKGNTIIEMKVRMKRSVIHTGIIVLVILGLDVSVAQISKHVFGWWPAEPAISAMVSNERKYRIPSSIYHHDLAKNVRLEALWGPIRYPYSTNSFGFRDSIPRIVSKHPKSHRILFIGDSFTEGLGVAFKDTFVGIIAERLKCKGIEVLNAAVASYSPAIYYRKIKYLLENKKIHFDHTIVFLDISDIEDEANVYWIEDDTVKGTKSVDRWLGAGRQSQPLEQQEFSSRVKIFLKNNSVLIRLADLIKDLIEGSTRGEELGTGQYRALWTLDDGVFADYGSEGLRRASENLDRLLDVLRAHGTGLTVVVYPWPDQILNGDLQSRQVTFWQAWTTDRNVQFINLFPAFISDEQNESYTHRKATIQKYYIPGEVHWNEAGHRLVAESFLLRFEFH